jgi:type II secretory pathway component PulK
MVMALATLLATRLMVAQDGFLTLVGTERELLQARMLAQGGVDWARAVLLEGVASENGK